MFRQVVGDVADQALNIGVAQKRRRFADQHGAHPEGLDDQTHLGQFLGLGGDALGLGGVQFDHFGRQEGLTGDGADRHLGLHPLIDEALVGGVLIHYDQAVAGLGDDIGAVQLGAGGAERIVDQVGRRQGTGRDLTGMFSLNLAQGAEAGGGGFAGPGVLDASGAFVEAGQVLGGGGRL
ncbi:hypothetical protein D3C72_1727540 [compost metagenome]